MTFLSASDTSFDDDTDYFIFERGDFSIEPVLGGSRFFYGACLSSEELSGTDLRSDWLQAVEEGAFEIGGRSEALLSPCYSVLVDCIKVYSFYNLFLI